MIGTTILEEVDSKFNGKLKVVNTWGMGNYIQAGGLTQSGGIVETIWKYTLKKLDKNFNPNSILILGLGGGTLAKLLRKKYENSIIVGLEIDSLMVELGKKYLKLDDYDVHIQIKDVNKFDFKKNNFDLVIIDMYQGDNFPKEFESNGFLSKAKNSLTDRGVIVINRLYFGEKRPDTVRFGNRLEKIFKKVTWVYPEANLMFICQT